MSCRADAKPPRRLDRAGAPAPWRIDVNPPGSLLSYELSKSQAVRCLTTNVPKRMLAERRT
eukprot:13363399-Alexandrium_andersonii.AAC.1